MKKTSNLLQQGDVIVLGAGVQVYAQIPEKFVYSNKPFSDDKTTSEVEIEKKYTARPTKTNNKDIVKDVQDAFSSKGIKLSLKKAQEFVLSVTEDKNKKDEFVFKGGEFLVIKTEMTGGSNDVARGDSYPDGHHVTAKRLSNGKYSPTGDVITFYQSGSFTIIIEPEKIKPTRKMSLNYE